MERKFIQIAGFTYSIPASVKILKKYLPFKVTPDENSHIISSISVEDIDISDKHLYQVGEIIDKKELHIYRDENNCYYAVINSKFNNKKYELYASPTWDKVIFSKECINADCCPYTIDILLMVTFIYSAASHNAVLLHASCVKLGEKAVAFIGQSGAGKSTHSQLWLNHIPGTSLLNDDQPAVRIHDNGEIIIYGTPWSGKTPCYKQEKATLQGMVRMIQAPYNKITPLSPVFFFKELLSSSSMMRADSSTFKLITSTLSKIASSISSFMLENRPEKEAVDLSYTKTIG